jgi:hypothetical protein
MSRQQKARALPGFGGGMHSLELCWVLGFDNKEMKPEFGIEQQ